MLPLVKNGHFFGILDEKSYYSSSWREITLVLLGFDCLPELGKWSLSSGIIVDLVVMHPSLELG